MELATHEISIQDTVTGIRNLSFQERKSPQFDEQKVNEFLDAIISVKEILTNKTTKVNEINDRIDKITWLNNLNEDELMLINDLIAVSRDLRSSLVRQYATLKPLKEKGVANNEIKIFKESLDDLKESYEDLEEIFFILPYVPGFVETTQKLEALAK